MHCTWRGCGQLKMAAHLELASGVMPVSTPNDKEVQNRTKRDQIRARSMAVSAALSKSAEDWQGVEFCRQTNRQTSVEY